MAPIRRILVVLDPYAQSTPALEKAAGLARALKAELWLGRFGRTSGAEGLGIREREVLHRFETHFQKQIASRLRELAAALRDEYQVTVHVVDEPAPVEAERIATCVAAHRIDLVVKDTQQEPALRRLLFMPVDWDLLRSCPVPLWLATQEQCALPVRVATAVDPVHEEHGATLNPAILGTASTIAAAVHADLRVFTCFAGLPLLAIEPEGSASPYEKVEHDLRSRHREAFDALLATHGIAPAQGTMLEGAVADTLVQAARDGAIDLLVIGTMRRRGLKRILMGSTAERLCAHASCDLLAVPDVAGRFKRSG
jgi:universal stress protein E